MVGGYITGITRVGGRINVTVEHCPHYPAHSVHRCPVPDSRTVTTDGIEPDGTPADIRLGDSFWWQCGFCYWTPRGRADTRYDVKLVKL